MLKPKQQSTKLITMQSLYKREADASISQTISPARYSNIDLHSRENRMKAKLGSISTLSEKPQPQSELGIVLDKIRKKLNDEGPNKESNELSRQRGKDEKALREAYDSSDGNRATESTVEASSRPMLSDQRKLKAKDARTATVLGRIVELPTDIEDHNSNEDDSTFTTGSYIVNGSNLSEQFSRDTFESSIKHSQRANMNDVGRDTRDTIFQITKERDNRINSQVQEIECLRSTLERTSFDGEFTPSDFKDGGDDLLRILNDKLNQIHSQNKEIELLREAIKPRENERTHEKDKRDKHIEISVKEAREPSETEKPRRKNFVWFKMSRCPRMVSNEEPTTEYREYLSLHDGDNLGQDTTELDTRNNDSNSGDSKHRNRNKYWRALLCRKTLNKGGTEFSPLMDDDPEFLPNKQLNSSDYFEYTSSEHCHPETTKRQAKKRVFLNAFSLLACAQNESNSQNAPRTEEEQRSLNSTSDESRSSNSERNSKNAPGTEEEQISLISTSDESRSIFSETDIKKPPGAQEEHMSLISTSDESRFTISSGSSNSSGEHADEEGHIHYFHVRSDGALDAGGGQDFFLGSSQSFFRDWKYDESCPFDEYSDESGKTHESSQSSRQIGPDSPSLENYPEVDPGINQDPIKLHLIQRRLFKLGIVQYAQDFEFIPEYSNQLGDMENRNDCVKTEIWKATFPEIDDVALSFQETNYFATVVAKEDRVDVEKLQVAISSEMAFATCPTIETAPEQVVKTLTDYKPNSTDPACHTMSLKLFLDESIIDLCHGPLGRYRDNVGSGMTDKCLWISKAKFISIACCNSDGVDFPSWVPKTMESSSVVEYEARSSPLSPYIPSTLHGGHQNKDIPDELLDDLTCGLFESDDADSSKSKRSIPKWEELLLESEDDDAWVGFVSESESFIPESDMSLWPKFKILVTTMDSFPETDDDLGDGYYPPRAYKPQQQKNVERRFRRKMKGYPDPRQATRSSTCPAPIAFPENIAGGHRGRRYELELEDEIMSATSASSFDTYY